MNVLLLHRQTLSVGAQFPKSAEVVQVRAQVGAPWADTKVTASATKDRVATEKCMIMNATVNECFGSQ